jgi:dehydrogenase/reductase SDR family protein 1
MSTILARAGLPVLHASAPIARTPSSADQTGPMGSLDGKVAVVVGASRGIGKGVALELAEAGAEVFLVGRSLNPTPARPGSLGETLRDITAAGGRAVAAQCDVLDEDAVAALFTWVRADTGRLDVIVNCAFDSSSFRSSIDQPYWEAPLSL